MFPLNLREYVRMKKSLVESGWSFVVHFILLNTRYTANEIWMRLSFYMRSFNGLSQVGS